MPAKVKATWGRRARARDGWVNARIREATYAKLGTVLLKVRRRGWRGALGLERADMPTLGALIDVAADCLFDKLKERR